jgi:DNA invertase Pin-like site-specific DNA recombinase
VQNCEPTCLRAMHRQADEMSYKAEHSGVSQSLKIERVCEEENINSHELRMGSRRRRISQVRAQIVHQLVENFGIPLAEVARQVGVSKSAISKALNRTMKN